MREDRRGQRRLGGKLKGLRRVWQDGKYYVYHRATGTRMPDLPETDPAFLAAYLTAEEGSKRPRRKIERGQPYALLTVWHRFCTSVEFRSFSTSYRARLAADGDKIMAKGAEIDIRTIRPEHIRQNVQTLRSHAAVKRLKTWRALMRYAVAHGLIDIDPSAGIAKPATPKATPHAPWTPAEIARFRAHHPVGTMQRLAFEILHYTGARMCDAVRLGPGMVDHDGWLTFRQQKTRGEVAIPFNRAVPEFIDAGDLAQLKAAILAVPRHMTWITTRTGKSRSEKSASQWFAAAARAAGIEGKTGHGLRDTRAVLLAEAGATPHQIGAWTGHESLKEIERYTKGAEKKRHLSRAGSRT